MINFNFTNLFLDGVKYAQDFHERSLLFWKVMSERGDNYLEHRIHKPPVVTFQYKQIKDGRSCKRKTNYDLFKIIPAPGIDHHPERRPIIIIDPRAGHGPGIGGSKLESEVGMALKLGHPVYFIMFHPDPIPNQTLADIADAEIEFLEEVIKRHEGLPKPAVIGNCQAGWAAAILATERPELVETLFLNGAPLSYWAGQRGKNPMRYRGGLNGGSWSASFLADLGNGTFDGAHLVDGFERLNPANTHWSKLYHLFSKVDSERQRFLDFEKWWGGFYFMTKKEIRQIVEDLFVGNKLERGQFRLRKKGKPINLRNITANVIIFCSEGDNITPPAQALQWIPAIYKDVAEMKQMKKRIIFCVHPKIGHLGIFVGSAIANIQHREIIGRLRDYDKMPYGLFELKIPEDGTCAWVEERTFADLEKYGVSFVDYPAFEKMLALSEKNQVVYDRLLHPLVKAISNSVTWNIVRFSHPLRVQRYAFSRLNPATPLIRQMAEYVDKNRKVVGEENVWRRLETVFANVVEENLRYWGNMRDSLQEAAFWKMFG